MSAGDGALLLVELAVARRFHRGITFPFVLGWARARGRAARWVRFGVEPTSGAGAGGTGAHLPPEDAAALERVIEEIEPSHVVFSHMPSAELLRALGAEARDLTWVCTLSSAADRQTHHRVGGVEVQAFDPASSHLDRILGVEDPEIRSVGLFEIASPDFGFEPANDLATRMEPLPFVVCGNECTYGAPVKGNPFYEGLALGDCARKGGCTFCARPESTALWRSDPLALVERQLRAIDRTCPRPAGRSKIRLVGERIMNAVDDLAALLLRLDLDPADYLLDSRADTLIGCRDRLWRALTLLKGSGHRLQLSLIGIESFAGAELGRLNKGLSPATNVDAVRTLIELEGAFPACFDFREHGGLSLITFTPWTRPEELDLNLTLAEQLGITELTGKLLGGRLRIYESLPLAAAARRDGLLTESYDDPLFDTAGQSYYEPELPWRFAVPVMEPLNRLLTRLSNEVAADADPLTTLVRDAAREARSAGLGSGSFGSALVRSAMALSWKGGGKVEPEAILEEVRAGLRGPAAGGTTEPIVERWERHPTTSADRGIEGSGGRLGEVPLSIYLESKPVMKREPVHRDDLRAWLDDPSLPNARAWRRPPDPDEPAEAWEVFFGHDPEAVARSVAATEALAAAPSRGQWVAAALEVGALLGYPRCCARAFAETAGPLRDHYTWMHIGRRLENPGPVPWELNPGCDALVEYVPCSLDCGDTRARARRLFAALGEVDAGAARELRSRMENPHLLLLGRQSTTIELLPEEEPAARFRYRAGVRRGGGKDVEAVVTGDELVLEPECVLVLRQGRPWASLSGRAFLWWHGGNLQTDLWRALVHFHRVASSLGRAPAQGRPSGPIEGPPWIVELDRLFGQLSRTGVSFHGFELAGWSADRSERLLVTLASPGERLRLALELRTPATPFLHEAGPFALSYPEDSPLDSSDKRRAARSFARKLDHILSRAR